MLVGAGCHTNGPGEGIEKLYGGIGLFSALFSLAICDRISICLCRLFAAYNGRLAGG